jgi:cupin 2 domain-containing protein
LAILPLARGQLFEALTSASLTRETRATGASTRSPAATRVAAGCSEIASAAGGGEVVTELVTARAVRIERIVSSGQASPEGFWYDQEEDEFVALLSGAAELEFEGGETVNLQPGEWIDIPAHVRHRVKWTAPDETTVWLAVFRGATTGEPNSSAGGSH